MRLHVSEEKLGEKISSHFLLLMLSLLFPPQRVLSVFEGLNIQPPLPLQKLPSQAQSKMQNLKWPPRRNRLQTKLYTDKVENLQKIRYMSLYLYIYLSLCVCLHVCTCKHMHMPMYMHVWW